MLVRDKMSRVRGAQTNLHDALNRLKGKTYSTGVAACPADPGYTGYAVKYYYDTDDAGAPVANGLGRRTVMLDGASSAAWTYDSRGRVTNDTRTVDGVQYATSFDSYDSMDRLLQATFVDGEQVSYTYSAQGWTTASGTWAVAGDVYRQSNATASNTNTYRAQDQSQMVVVRWKATYTSGTQAGIYLYASSATGAERGNSYRIWQDATSIKLYEVNSNIAVQRVSFAASNVAGQTHTYVARYSPITGRVQVWRDGVRLGGWVDTTPLTSGAYLSLRTDSSDVSFDDIEVYHAKK